MKIVKRIVLGLIMLLVILVGVTYAYLQTTKPKLSGEVVLTGLQAEVTVWFDEYGIPHIYAQHEEDAYYALGFVHAQDRLFQMEMIRRAASGRLAEVLGPDLLEVDKLFRTLGINSFAEEHAAKFLSSDTAGYQRAILAYQKGVNHFINTGATPLEFSIIGIPREEFTREDIYRVAGLISFGFAEGFKADPVLQKIREEFGDEYLEDLAVQTPGDAVRIKNFNGAEKGHSINPLIVQLGRSLEKLPIPLWQGSNGWVMSAEKSASGYPILANDTHMEFAQPPVWYEAHLEAPGLSLYGHHLAGLPFAPLGNTRFCGWGMTMFENDDVDFFIETLNPDNPNQVMYKGEWQELKTRTETIKVKGQADVALTVNVTPHGPIINGILNDVETEHAPVSVCWQAMQVENKIMQGAYQLIHAKSFQEAREAVSWFTSPGLNIMYGDVDGNIAWWAAAKLPVRQAHAESKLFLDGASGKDEYLGYYDFSKNPQSVNPPWGYVYSANNQPDTVDGVLYPGYYYPRSRAERIEKLLSEDKKYFVEDIKKIDLNVVSGMHVEIARAIASNLKESETNNAEISTLVSLLEQWDGNHQAEDIAPSVYYNMLSQIIFLAMEDELGAGALKSLLDTSIPKNSYPILIRNESSPWWDNISTKETKETRAAIHVKAAENTLALLKKLCGNNPDQWIWGKIHTLTHGHALGAVSPLDKIFNVGPFPVDGGSEVINNLAFDLDTTGYFPVRFGPALRKITDFGDLENGVTVSPSGQSGNLMSPHYSDQAELYAAGKFRKMMMNKEEIEQRAKNRLRLKP